MLFFSTNFVLLPLLSFAVVNFCWFFVCLRISALFHLSVYCSVHNWIAPKRHTHTNKNSAFALYFLLKTHSNKIFYFVYRHFSAFIFAPIQISVTYKHSPSKYAKINCQFNGFRMYCDRVWVLVHFVVSAKNHSIRCWYCFCVIQRKAIHNCSHFASTITLFFRYSIFNEILI